MLAGSAVTHVYVVLLTGHHVLYCAAKDRTGISGDGEAENRGAPYEVLPFPTFFVLPRR
jgi:hypothetical protein